MTMHTTTDELLIGNDLFFAEVERMLSQGQAVTLRGKGRSMFCGRPAATWRWAT